MKALLGLASLFQVIPKLSWLCGQEAEAGRGGGGKTFPTLLQLWDHVLQHRQQQLMALRRRTHWIRTES